MLQYPQPPTPPSHPPHRAEKPWQNAEEGKLMMGLHSETEAPWLGAGVICTDAGISRAETD